MHRNTHAPGRKSSAANSDATNRRADDALATAGRDSAFPESEATPQVVREAKDNLRLVEEVHWQLSGARQTAAGSQEGERRGGYQFGVSPKTALRDSAFLRREASPQVVSEANDYMAGFVLANGSMSSNQSGEGDIRRALIEADLVDTALRNSAFSQSEAIPQLVSEAKDNMVALPGQLFYSTQIPVCLWFLAKNKAADAKRGFRDRRDSSERLACAEGNRQ